MLIEKIGMVELGEEVSNVRRLRDPNESPVL